LQAIGDPLQATAGEVANHQDRGEARGPGPLKGAREVFWRPAPIEVEAAAARQANAVTSSERGCPVQRIGQSVNRVGGVAPKREVDRVASRARSEVEHRTGRNAMRPAAHERGRFPEPRGRGTRCPGAGPRADRIPDCDGCPTP